MQITYNRRTLAGDGCLEPNNGGLSVFGRELVAALNEKGILIDLSHAGPRTISDAAKASRAPIAISHTACAALVDRPRNVPDAEMRAVADRGGVIGIYLMPFLRAKGQPTADDLFRHIEHAVNVCGEDHVGIGSDQTISPTALTDEFKKSHRDFVRDRVRRGIATPGESEAVFNLVPEYNCRGRLRVLAADLERRGLTSRRIDKIMGGNFARLFRDSWTNR